MATEYHFHQLQPSMQRLYRCVEQAYRDRAGSVKLAGLHDEQGLAELTDAVGKDHPELCYVDLRHLSYEEGRGGMTYRIRYVVRPAMMDGLCRQVEDRAAQALGQSGVRDGDPAAEKCRKIHDWLIGHVRYHDQAMAAPDYHLSAFDVRGVLLEGCAVCEGIAKTFLLLCRRAGVECILLKGVLSAGWWNEQNGHAWNAVCVDGHWAHVDVTSDLGVSVPSGAVRYDYFLIPDEWMRRDHSYVGGPDCPVCGLSWFERNGLCVRGTKALRRLVETRLRAGERTLCFRAMGKTPPDIDDVVLRTANDAASRVLTGNYTIYSMPNRDQNVFLIRYERQ